MLYKLKDPNWRLQNLYSIVDKRGQKVLFKPNRIQEMVNQDPAQRKRILKARQFGISTYYILKQFDYTIWTPNATCCILAHEQDSIKKLFRIVKRAHMFMPDELRPVVDRGGGSKYEMYFPEINSRIYCDLESRSDTIHWLHASEVAFMKDPERLRATLQAVPLWGRVTQETTPNGMGNFFYDEWNEQNSTYKNFFFPWYLFDEYQLEDASHITDYTDEELEMIDKAKRLFNVDVTKNQIAFRRLKKSELKELFIQEYPEDDQSCFLSSGDAVMDLVLLKRLKDEAPIPIEDNGLVKIYKPYDKTRNYVCGADAAEGKDGDYSTAALVDARSREIVATIRGHLKPFDFAHELNDLCKRYATGGRMLPLLSVERNNHGHAVLLELKEHINYPNLYFRKNDDMPGWVTDKVTRPIMIDTFIEAVENRTFNLNDIDTINECLTLVELNGKIQAAEGKHDDTIIAASIALQMCIEISCLEVYDNIGTKILV